MRIFVTGASGYAGYHAAIRLSQLGHQVVGLVRTPEQARLDLLRIHQVDIVKGDLYDPASYRDVLAGCDAAIHTMLDKKRLGQTDRMLFETLESLPARQTRRRFIYTTGCSIFGKVGVDVMDESVEPNPNHPLAFRRDLEREALALKNVIGTVVRPGFMYGFDGFNSVSTDWFSMAREGTPTFRGDREKGWSWIHIADLAEAYRLVLEADAGAVAGEVFHLADNLRPKCVDVMRACLTAAGWTGEVRFEGSKQGDNVSTWFDQNEFITSQKARNRLNWTPRHAGVIACAPEIYRSWRAAEAAFG
jgi:nucleoside-diphosphate-sugar epimerase